MLSVRTSAPYRGRLILATNQILAIRAVSNNSPVLRKQIEERLKKSRLIKDDALDFREIESPPQSFRDTLLLGLVCYDPLVPSIWKGMMRHFNRCGLDVDFITYTSYERLVESFMKRHIHVAWNGPLAHARTVRLTNGKVLALGMRDVDRDFETHIVVRDDATILHIEDLNGKRIATGTCDSPQAYIMPLFALQQSGKIDMKSLSVTRYDRDIGKHGDTAFGEDAVLDALRSGSVQAGFISDLMWKRYVKAGRTSGLCTLEAFKVPKFDHCQFAGHPEDEDRLNEFREALLLMRANGDIAHVDNARTMELEGIRKDWMPSRGNKADAGYERMIACLDAWEEPPILWPGALHTSKRHPFKDLKIDYRLVRDINGC